MALSPFNKTFTNAKDDAFRSGVRPGDRNQLGPFPSAIEDPRDFSNALINKTNNPDRETFWQQVFSQETANQSSEKIKQAALSDEPRFPEPMNALAKDFLAKYWGPAGAVQRGLVGKDYVARDMLAKYVQEPAASRMNTKDPNTASTSQYPGAGGVNV
jgi:hypothetical protein